MRVGTKSVIFGVHATLVHPFFVAYAWSRLFGFPWDPRLWVAFLVHDLGYICKANMESSEGQQHVVLGGRIMGWLFGPEWRDFTLCHSRHWAERVGKKYSKLCLADKLAFVLTPAWLYLPMARLSGELYEYMRVSGERQLGGRVNNFELSLIKSRNPQVWLEGLKLYTRRWIEQHRDGFRDRSASVRPQRVQEQVVGSQS
ncbi:MAG: hypothetical protein ABSD45_24830 [Terriglobia bacterium]